MGFVLTPCPVSGKWCRLTGKKANNGYNVSHSHIRTKKLQHVNLHVKRVYWAHGRRWVKLRLSTKGMKTIEKIGLDAAARKAGIDLWSLPHQVDGGDAREQWKKVNGPSRTTPVDKRQMMNLNKLAASRHPLAAESKKLLDKLKPDEQSDANLVNLRKLSISEHPLSAEAAILMQKYK
mmetsp:Transcript_10262/g.26027  ORF Transcript_10262/g.26027 Transcript_10262/m.26027 type:complete len:178 (+) Transcript_10262:393-926(+)